MKTTFFTIFFLFTFSHSNQQQQDQTCEKIDKHILKQEFGSDCKCYNSLSTSEYDFSRSADPNYSFDNSTIIIDPGNVTSNRKKANMWIGCTKVAQKEILNILLSLNNSEIMSPDLVFSKLWIWNCVTVKIVENMFGTLKSEALILEGSSLSKLENLKSATDPMSSSLRHLILRNNVIKNLQDGMCSHMINLRTLDLSFNKINKISTNLFQDGMESTLRYLSFQNNNISMLSGKPFKSMTNLEHLNLANNQLSSLNDEVLENFEGLKNLRMLHLENNKIREISAKFFDHFPNLHTLNLGNNKLIKFGPFSTSSLQKIPLNQLSLNGNKLTSFPKVINLPNLQALNLNGNEIEEIDQDALIRMPHLIMLSLMSNKLEKLEFPKMEKLRVLSIQNNSIRDIPLDFSKKVQNLSKLDLARNKIQKVPSRSFESMRELMILNLARNDITGPLDQDLAAILGNLPNLGRLYLNGNKLVSVDVSFLNSLSNETLINVAENPLPCNCNLFPLYQWINENQKRVINMTSMKCTTDLGPQLNFLEFVQSADFSKMCPKIIVDPTLVKLVNPDSGPTQVEPIDIDPKPYPDWITVLAFVLGITSVVTFIASAVLFVSDFRKKRKSSFSTSSIESELNRLGWSRGEPQRRAVAAGPFRWVALMASKAPSDLTRLLRPLPPIDAIDEEQSGDDRSTCNTINT